MLSHHGKVYSWEPIVPPYLPSLRSRGLQLHQQQTQHRPRGACWRYGAEQGETEAAPVPGEKPQVPGMPYRYGASRGGGGGRQPMAAPSCTLQQTTEHFLGGTQKEGWMET